MYFYFGILTRATNSKYLLIFHFRNKKKKILIFYSFKSYIIVIGNFNIINRQFKYNYNYKE